MLDVPLILLLALALPRLFLTLTETETERIIAAVKAAERSKK